MQVIQAAFLFPAAIVLLSYGLGAGLQGALSRRLERGTTLVVGFAILVGVAELCAGLHLSASAAVPVLVVLALAGAVVGRIRRPRSGWEWSLVAAVSAAFVGTMLPAIMGGQLLSTGYLLDTTQAVQLQAAARIAQEGTQFGGPNEVTASSALLYQYFGLSYPNGAHAVLGYVGAPFGPDLLWLYTPFLATALTIATAGFWAIARRIGIAPFWSLVAAAVAVLPAITYAYYLQGSIKEIVALPAIVAIGAVAVAGDAWSDDVRQRVLQAVALAASCAALVGIIGPAGLAWAGLGVVVWLGRVFAVRDRAASVARARRLLVPAAIAVVAALVLAVPTLATLDSAFGLASDLSQSNSGFANDPGNLLRPIGALQAFGVWISSDHRVVPPDPSGTYVGIGVLLLAATAGVGLLVRDRRTAILAWLGGIGLLWYLLTQRGTQWTDAKIIVLTAPWIVFTALVAAGQLWRDGTRVVGLALGAMVVTWIGVSDVKLYRTTSVMPEARYGELMKIADAIRGDGPVLVPEFDEFAHYVLRDNGVDEPGAAVKRGVSGEAGGAPVPYGGSVSIDTLPSSDVQRHAVVVQRASPVNSRPPSNYRLASQGTYYDIWRRVGPPLAGLRIIPVNADGVGSGTVTCRRAATLVRRARRADLPLRGVPAPPLSIRVAAKTSRSPHWAVDGPDGSLYLSRNGELNTVMRVSEAGVWRLYLFGSVSRPVQVMVDDKVIGRPGGQVGTTGNVTAPLEVRLTAGEHRVRISRGGGTFKPGDDFSTLLSRIVLEREADPAAGPQVIDSARQICDGNRRWDWFEIGGATGTSPTETQATER